MKKQANKVIGNVLNKVAGILAKNEIQTMKDEYHEYITTTHVKLEELRVANVERSKMSSQEELRVQQEILLVAVELHREALDLALQIKRKADSIPQFKNQEIHITRIKAARYEFDRATKELQEVTEDLNDALFMEMIITASETLSSKLND